MKKLIVIILSLGMLQQCKKSDLHDLSGDITLKGVVVLYDTLYGIKTPVLQKKLKVFLKYSTDSGFLYSTTANDQAQYSFSGIEGNQSYSIYASSETENIKYAGQLGYTSGSFKNNQADTLKLFPSTGDQNGIHLIVSDSTGGRIANVTAWVFNSLVLFAADTMAGKIFEMKSNNYGVDNRLNLSPGRYYLRIKVRIGNLDLTGESIVDVPADSFVNANITLRSVPLASRNGMELQLNDVFGTPVQNASAYLYRSRNVWLLDSANANSLGVLQSNAAGLASTYVIDSARYYLRIIKPISKTDTLSRVDSIDVGKSAVSRKIFILD